MGMCIKLLVVIKIAIVIRKSRQQRDLMRQRRHWLLTTSIPELGVRKGDDATLAVTQGVRRIAIVVRVLGAETPATSLPERALLSTVVRGGVAAAEAIREIGFGAPTPLTQDLSAREAVFSRLNVGWPLSSENARDKRGAVDGDGWHGRGASGEEVLLKARSHRATCEISFDADEVCLRATFFVVELGALTFDLVKLIAIGAVPMDVSDNPRISEAHNGGVHVKA